MELPFRCSTCGVETMLDWAKLPIRPISKLYSVQEFICKACGKSAPCFFTTVQLLDGLRKLETMRPNHPSFRYHFVKTLRRAEEIQIRGEKEYGEIRHKNVVKFG
jgi:hypothetical protein